VRVVNREGKKREGEKERERERGCREKRNKKKRKVLRVFERDKQRGKTTTS
jgi:hypothetical protein